MESDNAFLNAVVQAAIPWIAPVIGAAMTLVIGWLGKRAALNKAATEAAEAAEVKHGPGAGEVKKVHARALLRKTMSGKLTTMHGLDVALDRQDFKAIARKASMAPEPPDTK